MPPASSTRPEPIMLRIIGHKFDENNFHKHNKGVIGKLLEMAECAELCQILNWMMNTKAAMQLLKKN